MTRDLNHPDLRITLTIRDNALVVTLLEAPDLYVSSAALPLVELETAIEAAVTVAATLAADERPMTPEEFARRTA